MPPRSMPPTAWRMRIGMPLPVVARDTDAPPAIGCAFPSARSTPARSFAAPPRTAPSVCIDCIATFAREPVAPSPVSRSGGRPLVSASASAAVVPHRHHPGTSNIRHVGRSPMRAPTTVTPRLSDSIALRGSSPRSHGNRTATEPRTTGLDVGRRGTGRDQGLPFPLVLSRPPPGQLYPHAPE
jgi:hypothetical protein